MDLRTPDVGRLGEFTRMRYLLMGVALLGMVLPASAQSASPIYCASFEPIKLKASANGQTADQRASAATDVVNKYLGGKAGSVTSRVKGKNRQILLNGEVVLTVTDEDAKSEKTTVSGLASRWASSLQKAFNASKAQK